MLNEFYLVILRVAHLNFGLKKFDRRLLDTSLFRLDNLQIDKALQAVQEEKVIV